MSSRIPWSDVRHVLERALALDSAERDAFLDDATKDRPELRARVEALLAADAEAETPLDQPAARDALHLLAAAPPTPSAPPARTNTAGTRLGAYRLIHEIGRGGMGQVFLAERADGTYQAQVAIKLMRAGPFGEDLRRRFEQERQILANLSHPNIARLLDGGVTPDGRPYLVLEHVEGEPIDRYCDRHAPPLAERLDLIQTVCRAVDAAHQALIVHCDLKPSNILITADRQVKLLDFGISRLLSTQSEALRAASEGRRALTPDYASPEQVRGEPLTTATDVYSLGVVLYRLLTGRSPYPTGETSRAEVERAVVDHSPRTPSQAVQASAAAGASPTLRPRQLVGDLDAIVLATLHKNPRERYPSVRALAEDLDRARTGHPVRARTPTVAYRLGRFVRRNAMALGAALLIVTSLAIGTVTTVLQARESARQGRTAERALDFLVELFELADPDQSEVATLGPLLDLLDTGVRDLDRAFADDAPAKARLLDAIGEVYRRLGHLDRAEPLLEEALMLRQAHFGPDHADVATSLDHLGFMRFQQDQLADAESLVSAALVLRRDQLGAAGPDVAESLHHLAQIHRRQGKAVHAELLYRQALNLRRQAGDQEDVAETLNSLAAVAQDRGRLDEAAALHEETLELRRGLYGNHHWRVASSLNNLGRLHRQLGHYAQAEALYREAAGIQRRMLGNHPSLATTLNNLAVVLERQGALAPAAQVHREALAMMTALRGEEHSDVATVKALFGKLLLRMGERAEAERLLREALTTFHTVFGNEHLRVAGTLALLSDALVARGADQEAERLLETALRIEQQKLDADHLRRVPTLLRLGKVRKARGNCPDAEPLFRQGWTIRNDRESAPSLVAAAAVPLAACLAQMNRPDEARKVTTSALAQLPADDVSEHAVALRAQLAALP